MQPICYEVREVSGLLHPGNPTLLQAPPGAGYISAAGPLRRIVLIDEHVLHLYGDELSAVRHNEAIVSW